MFDKFKFYLRWRERKNIVREAISYLYQECDLLDLLTLHEYCMLKKIVKRFKKEVLKENLKGKL